MTWFCPSCFAEQPQPAEMCPRCGTDPAADGRYFQAALIGALRHPLHDRRLLAARILGTRRAVAAVPTLIRAIQEGDDPYVAAEASRALVAIGTADGLVVVRQLAGDGPVIARVRPGTRSVAHQQAPGGGPNDARDRQACGVEGP